MITKRSTLKNMLSLIVYLVYMVTHVLSSTQFASHVSVSTPTRSFTHGVGDPISILNRRIPNRDPQHPLRYSRNPLHQLALVHSFGYPRVKPTIPFTHEELPSTRNPSFSTWQYNNRETSIPVLPQSPYKVDSSDPESLWPEGLFIPPSSPPRLATFIRRRADIDYEDPYLLEGSEAVAAVQKSIQHGKLYFHEIPHIESLLVNQDERVKNNLKPHRLGSIRSTWPFYRS